MPRKAARDYNAVMKPRRPANNSRLNVSLIFSSTDHDDLKSADQYYDAVSSCSTTNTAALSSPPSSFPPTPTSASFPPTPTSPEEGSYFETPRTSVSGSSVFRSECGSELRDEESAVAPYPEFSEGTREESRSEGFSEKENSCLLLDPTTPTNDLIFEYTMKTNRRGSDNSSCTGTVMKPNRNATPDKNTESPFSRMRASQHSMTKRKNSRKTSADLPVMTPCRDQPEPNSPKSSTLTTLSTAPVSRTQSAISSPAHSTLSSPAHSRHNSLSSRKENTDPLQRHKITPDARQQSKKILESYEDKKQRTSANSTLTRKKKVPPASSSAPPSSSSAAPPSDQPPVPPVRSSSRRASETRNQMQQDQQRIPIGRPPNRPAPPNRTIPCAAAAVENGHHPSRRDSTLYNDFEEMEAALLREEEEEMKEMEARAQETVIREQKEQAERAEQESKQMEMQKTIQSIQDQITDVDAQIVRLTSVEVAPTTPATTPHQLHRHHKAADEDEEDLQDDLEEKRRTLHARLIEERGKRRQSDDLISLSGMSLYSEHGLMLNQDIADYSKRELLESVKTLRREKSELEQSVKQLRCDAANERRKQDKVIKDLMAQIRGFHMPVQRSESSGPQETMALITDLRAQVEQLKGQNKSQTKLIERLVTERNHHLVEIARLKGNSEESIQLKEEVS